MSETATGVLRLVYCPIDTAPKDRKIMLFAQYDGFEWIGWEGLWQKGAHGAPDHWTPHYEGRDETKVKPTHWLPHPSDTLT